MMCRCCQTPKAGVMAPLCDRCFLGWNDCCVFRISLEQVIADSSDHVCRELGFYEVPFGLQIKRLNRKLKKEKEMELQKRVIEACHNDKSHIMVLSQ